GLGGCLPGMAPVKGKPGVCIDRWEAHVVELLDDDTEHTWSPYFNPGTLRLRAKSAPGAVPQAYISQVQAITACHAAKKRLCRDDEWVAACRGAKNTQFPYGTTEKRGTCNDHRNQHPAMQYLESANLSVFTKLEHPCINQLADSLLAAGTKKECVTPEGVFDIVGNLHEWTADPSGHFRGGYYVDTWLNGHGCDYVTTAHEARYWDYSTGFRCCAGGDGDAGAARP
ncbi:MAG TPA: SUMF1/EgtB/PvdO family nonheme iron enzyme, partial [Labilithrix sp.]|nr:SUMF1/EgtB/PvdO family nonheme iron enzyme [Labilithrix sp.]